MTWSKISKKRNTVNQLYTISGKVKLNAQIEDGENLLGCNTVEIYLGFSRKQTKYTPTLQQ